MRERRISIDLNSLEILDIAYIHSNTEANKFLQRAIQDTRASVNREMYIISIANGGITHERLVE